MIPYGRQEITQSDIDLVVEVLKSEYLTQGPTVPLFEAAVATHVGAKYAVAVNSATSALHIACLGLGLGIGDWLWTSPITFVASANCALYCGASVDFVDIDPKTYNLCPLALEQKLVETEKVGRLPKVVVAVHLCGQSCDMVAIDRLSQKYGFKVIEDASHAVGGKYKGAFIGAGQYSDVTIFSFHPVKIITTAEGGMALTKDATVAERMALYRSHGITREPDLMTQKSEGAWYYEQITLGFNYRMTELHAALGSSQLQRLDSYVLRRQQLACKYDEVLEQLPVRLPWQHPDSYSAFHLYVVRLQQHGQKKSKRQIFQQMRSNGIGVNVHYIPVHLQPYYQRMGFKVGDFPEAEKYYLDALTLPLYPTMEESDLAEVCNTLKCVLA